MTLAETLRSKPCRVAFTLIEVAGALAVLALATYVVVSALISVARAQTLSEHLRRGALTVRTVEAQRWIAGVPINDVFEVNGWTARAMLQQNNSGGIIRTWRVWTLSPKDRPSLRIAFASPMPD